MGMAVVTLSENGVDWDDKGGDENDDCETEAALLSDSDDYKNDGGSE